MKEIEIYAADRCFETLCQELNEKIENALNQEGYCILQCFSIGTSPFNVRVFLNASHTSKQPLLGWLNVQGAMPGIDFNGVRAMKYLRIKFDI